MLENFRPNVLKPIEETKQEQTALSFGLFFSGSY